MKAIATNIKWATTINDALVLLDEISVKDAAERFGGSVRKILKYV